MYFHNFTFKSIYKDVLILFLVEVRSIRVIFRVTMTLLRIETKTLPMSLFSLYLVYITMTSSFFFCSFNKRENLKYWVANNQWWLSLESELRVWGCESIGLLEDVFDLAWLIDIANGGYTIQRCHPVVSRTSLRLKLTCLPRT